MHSIATRETVYLAAVEESTAHEPQACPQAFCASPRFTTGYKVSNEIDSRWNSYAKIITENRQIAKVLPKAGNEDATRQKTPAVLSGEDQHPRTHQTRYRPSPLVAQHPSLLSVVVVVAETTGEMIILGWTDETAVRVHDEIGLLVAPMKKTDVRLAGLLVLRDDGAGAVLRQDESRARAARDQDHAHLTRPEAQGKRESATIPATSVDMT